MRRIYSESLSLEIPTNDAIKIFEANVICRGDGIGHDWEDTAYADIPEGFKKTKKCTKCGLIWEYTRTSQYQQTEYFKA